jgi:hypothetical protein
MEGPFRSRTASCLIIAGWKIVGRLSAGIMRDRIAATASVLNRSSMWSRAGRRRGEGRSPELPCLTALTDGLTNDGGMTDYLLLFFKAPAGR